VFILLEFVFKNTTQNFKADLVFHSWSVGLLFWGLARYPAKKEAHNTKLLNPIMLKLELMDLLLLLRLLMLLDCCLLKKRDAYLYSNASMREEDDEEEATDTSGASGLRFFFRI
jgi:hypothetical protein